MRLKATYLIFTSLATTTTVLAAVGNKIPVSNLVKKTDYNPKK